MDQLQKDFKKKGEFDLNLMGVQISLEKPSNFRLQFQGIERIFEFQATNIVESNDWKNQIETSAWAEEAALENGQDFYENLHNRTALANGNVTHISSDRKLLRGKSINFWKYSRIFEFDLREIADTGDVLLFKGRDAGSAM